MSLRIETIESLDGLEAIEHEWRELWRQDRTASPFQSPDWLSPWTRHLWREYKYQWGSRDRVNRKLMAWHSAGYARDVA